MKIDTKCYFCQEIIIDWKQAFWTVGVPANLKKSVWTASDYPVHEKCYDQYRQTRKMGL